MLTRRLFYIRLGQPLTFRAVWGGECSGHYGKTYPVVAGIKPWQPVTLENTNLEQGAAAFSRCH